MQTIRGISINTSEYFINGKSDVFRTSKKRKFDNQGRVKLPQYRSIPVPDKVIDDIDLVFDLRRLARLNKEQDQPLWTMSRATTWRMVKGVMARAGIKGKQATSNGLRHGFGIAILSGEKALPLNILRDLMGHSDTKITEIYISAIGAEKRKMVMNAWQ
ncbi:phage integrase [methanotrophic endosymbiont of Bathymodiolus azoricus (Menez Gwen)]|nr:phage integrase [methanotrophic endosymbiont of Bathymodiolus azoricus (Menez Gwen)]